MPRLVNAARYASGRFRLRRKHTDVCVPAAPHDISSQTRHFLRATTPIPGIYVYVWRTRSNRGRDIYWRPAITEATICHAAVLIT